MVIVELIDFTVPHHDESSSDHDDNIQHLFNLLKLGIRNNRPKKFSLQFEPIGQLESIGSHCNYDIVISEKHNILVATQSSYLVIYNRTPFNQSPISDKILFKVHFGVKLKCMKLNIEKDEEFIYVSTTNNSILKINLTKLLITKDNSLIWKLESETCKSLLGIDIWNNRLYIGNLHYSTRVFQLVDCETGKITNEDPKLPKIVNAHQLVFISPKEMIIIHNCVELFHLKEGKWKSVRRTSFRIESAFYIFYERESQLIYLSDTNGTIGEKLKVINSKDMSLVKSFGQFKMNFGICIDRLSGLLYVCDLYSYTTEVFK